MREKTEDRPTNTNPQTYAEAVAAERAKWGDAWNDKRDPVPVCCIAWRIEMVDLLRTVMAGPEVHRRVLAARARMGKIPEERIRARAENGDKIRAMILDWVGPGWVQRLGKRHLALLLSQQLLPQPANLIVREWIYGRTSAVVRSPADLDERMAQAEQDQVFGGVA